MGDAYRCTEQFSEAKKVYKEALMLADSINSPTNVFIAKINLAQLYLDLKNPHKAKIWLDGAQLHFKGLEQRSLPFFYKISGYYYLSTNQAQHALGELKKGYPFAIKRINRSNLEYLDFMIKAAEQIGDYKSAYTYFREYKIMNDKIISKKNIEALTTERLNYESQKKELELLKEQQLLEEQVKRQQLIQYAMAMVATILLIISLITYFYFKSRNRLLQKDIENKNIIATQAKKIQALYDYKNNLFANIAHELKTPLTLMLHPVANLLRKTKDVKDKEQLQLIANNTKHLQFVSNQILDLIKSENYKLQALPVEFKLHQLLHSIRQEFRPFADFQQVTFLTPSNIREDIALVTDGEKLMTVLKNILSNAFKHTQASDTISLSFEQLNEEELLIQIEDTGKGIPEADVPYIFDRYFQANISSNNSLEGGMGIGLAICKEYMKLLKGTIKVSSTLHKGSTFSIQFPRKIAGTVAAINTQQFLALLSHPTANKAPLLNGSATEQNSTSPKLLIVEDNLEMCQLLKHILSDQYRLIFAGNGKLALTLLQEAQPDLIITDLMMPVMNGFELINFLKNHDSYRHIPIIVLTARHTTKDKLKALNIGVDDYLMKPFIQEELIARIHNLLHNSNLRFAQYAAIVPVPTIIAEKEDRIHLKPLSLQQPTFQMTHDEKEWLDLLEAVVKTNLSAVTFNLYQLAEELTISYSGLFPKIKKLTGLTPNQYINEVRYAKARELLQEKRYSVKKAAYSVGFKDPRNFSRNYKKKYGKLPSKR